jgi:hypothetical protein
MAVADVGQLEVEVKHDWILITYDIPRKHDAVRKKVIRGLRKMGGMRHTDSVYYLPYNAKAYEIAATLPGEAYVWRSSLTSDTQAKQLTQDYYNKITEGLEKLHERLDILEEELPTLTSEARQERLNYTVKLFESLKAAANNIGLLVYEGLADVGQRLDTLRERIWGATT